MRRKVILVGVVGGIMVIGAVCIALLWLFSYGLDWGGDGLVRPSVQILDSHGRMMEEYAKAILDGDAELRADGLVGYVVPEGICKPAPVIITRDHDGNVFFETQSTVFSSAGYVLVSRGLLPRDPPTEPRFTRLEHLRGAWYAYDAE